MNFYSIFVYVPSVILKTDLKRDLNINKKCFIFNHFINTSFFCFNILLITNITHLILIYLFYLHIKIQKAFGNEARVFALD